ncbi:MAG TPA: sensor histidine kinase, partial [Ignavibacteriaceae bacterium]
EISSLADDCTRLVEKTISVVRNLSLELRPSIIDDLGLAASLRWYADKFSQRTGMKVKTEIDIVEQILPAECAITLFRICQEALTNIAKHSEAEYVKVTLNKKNSSVTLTIEDDGKGFDLQKALKQAVRGKSLGLLGMQERAELLGGRFKIKSSEGSGTVVIATCQVPK